VADAIFAHPRLALAYDAFDGLRDDLDAYVGIATELGADRVLDVGCGTGCLAILLAGTGRTVVGVDPAAASLAVARSKEGGSAVTWIHGDASQLPAAGADLAVMTGNVAQVFLTDADWARTLQAVGAALRPGGYLVFETRRPARRAWEEWAADTGPVTLDVPGVGPVERRLEVMAVDLPLVSFRYTYTFLADGAVITSDSTLRFRSRAELETSLAAAHFQVLDVRDAPDRPGREFVFITQRTTSPGDLDLLTERSVKSSLPEGQQKGQRREAPCTATTTPAPRATRAARPPRGTPSRASTSSSRPTSASSRGTGCRTRTARR
jgi:SAM-dependent methyltransferase